MERRNQGFTLVELAVVLVISSIILLMTFDAIDTQFELNSYRETQTRLNTIKIALENYKTKFGRLPCPASQAENEGSATYLTEVASCTSTSCSAGVTCPTGVAIGAVPVKTLGLGNRVGIDSWDNKIRYAVDSRFTADSSSACEVTGKLIIVDSNNNPINASGNAVYFLASTGKDGAGAYTDQGVLAVSCNASHSDYENCADTDLTFKDGKFSDGDNSNYYDDIIAWDANHKARQSPSGVSGAKIWFDGADICSVTHASGVVSAWQDKSVSNLSAVSVSSPTYITTTTNSTNGKPHLQFSSGSVNMLSTSGVSAIIPTTNFTQVIVFLPSSARAAAVINAANSNTYNPGTSDRVFGTNASGFLQYNMAGGSVTDTTAASITSPTIATIKVDSTAGQTMFTNGVQTGTSATTTSTFASPTHFNIGGVSSLGAFDGKILEIIFYDRVLTTGEQQQIETTLAAKWGVVY